jgi:hypothetical protein
MAASRLLFENQQKRSPAIPLPMPTTLNQRDSHQRDLKQPIRQQSDQKPKGKAIDIIKLNKAKGMARRARRL